MTDCRCHEFRGEPDHAAEQVAANLTAGHDWLAAYRAVFAPWLLPGRVSVSERLKRRLRAMGESGVAAAKRGRRRRAGAVGRLPRRDRRRAVPMTPRERRHAKPTRRRPTFTRTTAADRSIRYVGPLRSSCGHLLGVAAVWRGHQWVIQWAVCR